MKALLLVSVIFVGFAPVHMSMCLSVFLSVKAIIFQKCHIIKHTKLHIIQKNIKSFFVGQMGEKY